MPRVRTDLTQTRRKAILVDILADEKPAKVIAADHGISLSWVRNVLWGLGYRSMVVSEAERKAILAQRTNPAATS